MNVRGKVVLTFHVGDLRLTSTFFVFNKLGAPILLGTNALVTHGLCISPQKRVIFSEAENATAASRATLQFEAQCATCASCLLWCEDRRLQMYFVQLQRKAS